MTGVAESELVERGRKAASTGDWPRAFDLLAQADRLTRLTVDDLGLLAEAAYAAGHLDITIGAWERAHARNAAGPGMPGPVGRSAWASAAPSGGSW